MGHNMARKLKVAAAVLNVRLHPHSPALYVDFFRRLYGLRKSAQIHGDRYGLISTADFSSEDKGHISGVVTTFTRFEKDGTWFDTQNLEEASNEKIAEVYIPDGLFPNAASYYFHFDIPTHRLYFETYSNGKSITVHSILRFLENISGDAEIIAIFKRPIITIVQNKSSLEELYSMDRIKRIEIIIQKPNADVFADDFEEEVERHLEEANSRSMKIIYEADDGKSIDPTPPIIRVSETATANGEIVVSGRDNGAAVVRSSEAFPTILQSKYDPDLTSEAQAFKSLVRGD